MITNMHIRNDQEQIVMNVSICPTREGQLPEALETLLKYRRKVYMANCPRQYQHLVDLREWYWVTEYNPTLDPDEKHLEMLVDSRYRVVLIHDERDLTEWNSANKNVHFIGMTGTWDTWLAYPVGEECKNDYLSQVLAGTIEMGRHIDHTEIFYPEKYDRKVLYDDSLIARMVQDEYIPVSDISYIDAEKKEKAVLIRYHEYLYQVPIEETKLNHRLIDFTKMEYAENIYMIGDIVRYNQTTCVIVGVQYGERLDDPMNHLYTIVNVKRSQDQEMEVTGLELHKVTATVIE